MSDEYVYVLQYYDYDNESRPILGVYKTWDETAAEIVDRFDGQFDFSQLKPPEHGRWDSPNAWETRQIKLEGDYGEEIIVKKVRLG